MSLVDKMKTSEFEPVFDYKRLNDGDTGQNWWCLLLDRSQKKHIGLDALLAAQKVNER